ncbi:glycerophosphodiester phosphodiesterase [Guptibacillus algicola]|uniref:glycerophosphodiester phosphodiesterase n=1 Tax=Guptibacillus algicola TaxID=225844 RepID=UPI001CD45EA8|nr:glycerophosphodiester phosphodiesterase [Alkalihalobacillus algicola]MCA0986953.1 glycerophosphodiester phosphodiesterase [Alkalihalobacillus algicola]
MKRIFKATVLSLSLLLFLSTITGNTTLASPQDNQSEIDSNERLNVAHRGASGHAPEHTIPSYELGDQMNGDYIEIDLQMTKDGVLVAMHDETVDRTTDGTGLVKDYTLEELKKLDAGSWFNEENPEKAKPSYEGLEVPTLEEVIQTFGKDKRYYIETKSPEVYPGMEKELLRVLEKYELTPENEERGTVLIQSFSKASLLKMHDLAPNMPLVQLIHYVTPATITNQELQEINRYAVGVGMSYNQIDQEYVEKVRESGLLIHPYTVNEKEDMKRLLDWGVTGMFTNYPDRLDDVMDDFEDEDENEEDED